MPELDVSWSNSACLYWSLLPLRVCVLSRGFSSVKLLTYSEQHSIGEAREGQSSGRHATADGTDWTDCWKGILCMWLHCILTSVRVLVPIHVHILMTFIQSSVLVLNGSVLRRKWPYGSDAPSVHVGTNTLCIRSVLHWDIHEPHQPPKSWSHFVCQIYTSLSDWHIQHCKATVGYTLYLPPVWDSKQTIKHKKLMITVNVHLN